MYMVWVLRNGELLYYFRASTWLEAAKFARDFRGFEIHFFKRTMGE